MGRPEKPVDSEGGVVAAFASELRALRAQAGNPTYRDMARTALYSSSVLSSAASGRRLPTLKVALAFVAACGGDRETWRRKWLIAADAHPAEQPEPVPRPPLPRPAQLPMRPRGFVGRDEELAGLSGQGSTPVVITGPVGVGKSELALRHAHDLAATTVDGQLYADLDPLPPGPRARRRCSSTSSRRWASPPRPCPSRCTSAPGSTGRCSPSAGSWCCWTTSATSGRSARCWPRPAPARPSWSAGRRCRGCAGCCACGWTCCPGRTPSR
ncbi:helix-turn-helix domain-containing protein [Actinokineospora soli]|uniref:Helix-turn-helix domain-containing protein n=1 Tax=Actinokineospora soli TaxID=1048753 RepID=A0ABW2TTE8_9PSEU